MTCITAPTRQPDPDRRDDRLPAWRRWVQRYAPAEIVGTFAAVSVGTMASTVGGPAAIGLVASWAETVGFYGTMAVRDLSKRLRAGGTTPLRAAAATTSTLATEFGPAEVLDTFLLRPALIAASLALSPSPLIGIVAGKLLADLAFYVLAIASWELLRGGTSTRWSAQWHEGRSRDDDRTNRHR